MKNLLLEEQERIMESPAMKRVLGAENLLMATGRMGQFEGKTIPEEISLSHKRVLTKLNEEIEKLRRGSPYINGDFKYKNEEAFNYNLALSDIQAIISNYLNEK